MCLPHVPVVGVIVATLVAASGFMGGSKHFHPSRRGGAAGAHVLTVKTLALFRCKLFHLKEAAVGMDGEGVNGG